MTVVPVRSADLDAAEVAWFSALCSDDYRFLGVPEGDLRSSWEHCSEIVTTAERLGFRNILCPSSYQVGQDTLSFVAGCAPITSKINMLAAIRCGEMQPIMLARTVATLDHMLANLKAGDIRRGQQVFHSSKVACSSCHALGYLGGNIGPDLTRIGNIRSERDLLESILFPSASFVRSYEPVLIATSDGQVYNGVIRNDSESDILLATGPDKFARIAKDGGRGVPVQADVSRRTDCDRMVQAAIDAYGRLDVLYNNAAIQMSGTLVDTTEAMWDITIATNLTAIFRACRAAIEPGE